MTEVASLLPNSHRLTSVKHYEARPPKGLELVEPGETFATTKEEEWISKKKTEVLNTKQIETRVKRQVVLEDGKVVEDSGPMVTTNTTEDSETQEHHQTELRKLGNDDVDGDATAIEGPRTNVNTDKSNWVAVPNPDGVVREVKERRVVSREETEEVKETEDVQHLGDITDKEFLAAVRTGKSDIRSVLRSSEGGRAVVSTGPRVIRDTSKSKKVTDTEDTRELSSVLPDGKIVTETQRTTEHEEVKDDELPDDAPERDFHKESSQRYLKTREQEDVDYLADGKHIGHEMRYKTETMEIDKRGDNDMDLFESLSDRAKRRANGRQPHRYRGISDWSERRQEQHHYTQRQSPPSYRDSPLDQSPSHQSPSFHSSSPYNANSSSPYHAERPSRSPVPDYIRSQHSPVPDYRPQHSPVPDYRDGHSPSPDYAKPVKISSTPIMRNGHISPLPPTRKKERKQKFVEREKYVERDERSRYDSGYRSSGRNSDSRDDRLDRLERFERVERDKLEMLERDRLDRLEKEKQRAERDRLERDRIEREKIERERADRDKVDKVERDKYDRVEREKFDRVERDKFERAERERVEEPPPDYSPPSPAPVSREEKRQFQKTRFAADTLPAKSKGGNIIGQSIRKLVNKIRSASAERKAKNQRAKRSPSPSYQQGHVIDNNISHSMDRQPVQRYYLGEDPFGGSIYGRENKYDGAKPIKSSRKQSSSSRDDDKERRSQSTLGRFSKSTGRLVNSSGDENSRRETQTLPRNRNKYEPNRLNGNQRSSSTINVSIINNVTPSRFANEGPAKPARTYKSNLARSKSLLVQSDLEQIRPRRAMYTSNTNIHRLNENPGGLKSPGLISSLNRSHKDITENGYTSRFLRNGDSVDNGIRRYPDTSSNSNKLFGERTENKRVFMSSLKNRSPELFKTLNEDQEDWRVNSYSTPIGKTTSRNFNGNDMYEPPTRLRDTHFNSTTSPSHTSLRRGSTSSTDFSETYHTTTRSDDPHRPSVTNTVKTISKKTVPTKDGRGVETIESSETRSVTKSHYRGNNRIEPPPAAVSYYESDRRYDSSSNSRPVVIEVRNNYRK